MNGILTDHLNVFWLKNSFQMSFNIEIKRRERVFMEAKFIVSLLQAFARTNRAQDHLGHYLVQYLENSGPATEQSDWLILVIGPQAA